MDRIELQKLKPGTLLKTQNCFGFPDVEGYAFNSNFEAYQKIPCGSVIMFLKHMPDELGEGACKILSGNKILYVAGWHLKELED